MASSVLESGAWSVARSHIQFALGRQAYHLGRLEEAVEHFSSVLADTKQTPQQQVAHIREFLFIYKQYTTQVGIDPLKASLPQLGLPVIDDRDILVTLSNVQSTRHHEEWDSMELELLESGIEKGLISSSKRAMAVKQQDDHRVVCAVGEPSTVHIELYNPLQVAISLSNIVLGCDHRTSIETSEHTGQSDMDENMPEGTPVGSDGLDFDAFQLQKIEEMTLEPLEKRTISLTLIPHLQGSIRVTGLHYTLNELVHTFRPFHKKGKRLNKTMEERMSVVHAPDCSLDILVTSPMPLLDIAFHNAPETLLSGEVVQTVLEINNKGNKGLTALRLKNSHPSFICIGHPEEMDKDIYARKEMATDKTQLSNQLFDASVISIPLPAADQNSGRQVVMPGETTLVPLWIRGDRIGKHTFRLLFSYQSEQDNATIAHRTLRYTLQVQVLPSLKINAFTRPSTTTVNEYILGMEIENLQTVANFELSQLMATSPMWTISPLSMNMDSPEDVQEKTIIAPRQTTFAYYKIRKSDVIDDSCPEAWTSNALTAMLSNGDTKSVSGPPDINLYQTELSFVSKKYISPFSNKNDSPFVYREKGLFHLIPFP
jgi:hypothetical protein